MTATATARPITLAPPKRSAPMPRRKGEDAAKACPKCSRNLTICSFSIRRNSPDRRMSWCRECQSGASSRSYQGDRKAIIKRSAIRQRQTRGDNRTWLALFLADKLCMDCGESAADIFEFDHRHGAKSGSVSKMLQNGFSLRTIEAEIAKCDILCPNCHRIRTQADVNSYLHRYVQGTAAADLFEDASTWVSPSGSKNEAIMRHTMGARQRNKLDSLAWLLEHPCVDCGNDDVRVLEYDHVRGKSANMFSLIQDGAPLARVHAERDKCDVRCVNCHRRRSHNCRPVAMPELAAA
jgi:hypothetical protein